jgi:ABC-2 type transport system permease protein
MFFRVVVAEAKKNLKQYFFSARTLFWALFLPLGNGLYLYFLYLPFAARTVNLEFNASNYTLDLVGFTLVGQLLYSFFTFMLLSGTAFDIEREQGTLEAILLSPANRMAVLLGGALASASNYLWLLIGIMLSWVSFLHVNVAVTDLAGLLVSILLSYSSLVAVGTCLEAFFIHSRRGVMYGTMLQEPVMFFSALIFPIQSMPSYFLPFSYLLPLTFGLISVRLTLFGGASMTEIVLPLTALALMTAIFFVLGALLIGFAEKSAKAKATLTQF